MSGWRLFGWRACAVWLVFLLIALLDVVLVVVSFFCGDA